MPLLAAWIVALASTLGALFIGEVMGRTPCDLCWYQRAFMFPLAVVLAVASFRGDMQAWRYALPLALVGALLAGFHSLLFVGVIPEAVHPCSQGVPCSGEQMTLFGLVPLPLLSFAAFACIAGLLLMARRKAVP
jgi:disulfide bond formation protein DsbB